MQQRSLDSNRPTTKLSHDEMMASMLNALVEQQRCVIDDCLPVDTINALRALVLAREAQGQLKLAGTSKAAISNPKLRGDHIAWLEHDDPDPALQAYFTLMQQLQQSINRHLMMGLQTFETHIARYPAGSHGYATHLDQFRLSLGQTQANSINLGATSAGCRRLSVILYLNDDWPQDAGGQLRIYLETHEDTPTADARHIDIAPVGGRLVLFLSDRFWHQVMPAKQARISLTGWFKTANY